MKNIFILLVSLIVLISLQSCSEGQRPQELRKVAIPSFDADRAYGNIHTQVDFGPRVVGYQGHEDVINWMIETLKSYGYKPEKQAFKTQLYTGEEVLGTNVIASHNRGVKERLLLGAHFDTRPIADKDSIRTEEPIPGADDGASGVGVLLEIARLVKNHDLPMGVDFVFFDLEDYGQPGSNAIYSWGLGSQYWSKKAKKQGYSPKYGIFLDMVGAENAQFTIEGLSAAVASKQVEKIWRLAIGMGREDYFIPKRTEPIVDDHRFVFEITAIPVVNIVNHGEESTFASYHHTHNDNMDIISKETLKAVGQVVTAVVFKESNHEF